MILNIKLKNFKKHGNISVDFTSGLQCLKGANEAGKSSLIEGLTYNWFGSKGLKNGLDKAIKYGCKKSEMKTETTFEVGGKVYNCKRAASGAEITHNNAVVCTGQTEATSYIENLFGIPSGTAHMLMVARQNDIRGILENGKAHEFIEKLADFSEIDNLLDTLQSKLNTGATGPAKLAVEHANEALENISGGVAEPIVPDTTKLTNSINCGKEEVTAQTHELDKLSSDYNTLTEENNQTLVKKAEYEKLNTSLSDKNSELSSIAVGEVDQSKLPELKTSLKELNKRSENHDIYQQFLALTPRTEDEWDNDLQSLEIELNSKLNELSEITDKQTKLTSRITVAKATYIHDKNCPTCGQEVPNVDDINLKSSEDVEKLQKDFDSLGESNSELTSYVAVLEMLKAFDSEYCNFAVDNSDLVKLNTSIVPAQVTWVGKEPTQPLDTEYEAVESAIKDIEFALRSAERSRRRITELTGDIDRLKSQLAESITDFTVKPTAELRDAIKSVTGNLEETKNILSNNERELVEITNNYKLAKGEYTSHIKTINMAEDTLKQAQASLKELAENNSLLKAVRVARIEVTDLIWGMVLKSINNYFNTLRGEVSVLAKDTKGFTCNGSPVSDLSGSTLDILGLAIRFALTRLFLPGVGLQVLDEPGSGMDSNRSRTMMGFVAASGFDQTIIVSHNVDDDVAANNLVEI